MMESSSMVPVRIGRKSSIENEPRTLGYNQMHYARELAKYVMKTRNMEEAKQIFTEGLEPVVSVMMKMGDEKMDSVDECEYRWEDHLQFPEIREVVSAPF